MGRNWKSIRDKEIVEKIKLQAIKNEKRAVEILKNIFSGYIVEWINQDTYKTYKDRMPDAVVKNSDGEIIVYIEISASVKYSYKYSKNFTLSKTVHVETEKVEHFINGYNNRPVYYAYLFADGVIKFCRFNEMKHKGEEIVRSFGINERSDNYIITTKSMYNIKIEKDKNGKDIIIKC